MQYLLPVALSLEFVKRTTSLEQRLVDTTTTGNDTDCRARARRDRLFCATGETNTGLVVLRGMTDDGCVVARCACKCTTVTNFLLDIADDGTLWALAYREDIANGENSLFTAVDECASVKTLCSDKGFLAMLVAIRIAEDDPCQRCAADPSSMSGKPPRENASLPARIVDDLLDDTTNVSITLSKV